MNIWLISAFEPLPIDDTRPMRFLGIAEELLKNGHTITFWSSSYNHYKKEQRCHEDQSIKINDRYILNLIYTKPYKKNISVSRLLSHKYFADKMNLRIQKEKKPDLIYLAFPPINILKVIAKYARINNVVLVVDIIDPWPDAFLNILPDYLKRPLKIFFANFYKTLRVSFSECSAIFSISNTYIQWAQNFLNKKPMQYMVFYPAVNTSLYLHEKSKITADSGPLKFIYAGTLGAYYDIETIIEVAKDFDKEVAEFTIVGDGPKRKQLELKSKGIDNVKFTGWLSSNDLNALLINSHVGLATYTKNGTQTVTYKLFDYLAAGLPILSSLDGEMRQLIEEKGLGYFCEAENRHSLKTGIQRFIDMDKMNLQSMKLKALEFAKKNGDTKVVYGRLAESVERIFHDK